MPLKQVDNELRKERRRRILPFVSSKKSSQLMWNPSAFSFTLATSWLCVGLTHRGLQHQTCYSNALQHTAARHPPKKKNPNLAVFLRACSYFTSAVSPSQTSASNTSTFATFRPPHLPQLYLQTPLSIHPASPPSAFLHLSAPP